MYPVVGSARRFAVAAVLLLDCFMSSCYWGELRVERQSKTHIAAVVLSTLLGMSVLTFGGSLAFSNFIGLPTAEASTSVSDNLISQGGGYSQSSEEATSGSSIHLASAKTQNAENAQTPEGRTASTSHSSSKNPSTQTSNTTSTSLAKSSAFALATANEVASKEEATIELYGLRPEENTAFQVGNMFPGDSETKNYRVRVSYRNQVTVHFSLVVRQGYEKLAEVMKVRITLPATGEVVYDGLMRDVPDGFFQQLSSKNYTADELQYEVTAYLDTNVGNEYQNQDLIADLTWSVEETGNLAPIPLPGTGDPITFLPVVCLALVLAAIFAFCISFRIRKGGEQHE